MKLAVYYRCSTDDQSLEHQRQSVKRWIKTQGYENYQLTEYEDEGQSGAKDWSARPGFEALINAVKGRKIESVLLFEGSRLSRDMMTYLRFMELANKSGVKVELVGKGLQGFSTSQEMLLSAIEAFSAQFELEKISERIKSGLARRKAEGKPIGAQKGNKNRQGKFKSYSPTMVEEIKKLSKKGLGTPTIAEILGTRHSEKGVSHTTVWRIRRKLGLT